MNSETKLNEAPLRGILIILVAALGYFVDAYDLILFVVLRKASLTELGLSESEILEKGLWLFNVQMIGTLCGGILFGVLGDKKGRLSVLFGSIILYSLANFANAFVQNIEWYAILRFLAGVGLAGELGAGVTIVAETMSKEKRGYGTAIVAAAGAAGAFTAGFVGDMTHWRTAFMIGGGMGLLLLFLRIGTFESKLFEKAEKQTVSRGDFFSLFTQKDRFRRYFACMLIGLPIFFVLTILMQLAPEVAKAIQIKEPVTAGKAVLFVYIGLSVGDLSCGLLSQYLKSRKKAIYIFSIFSFIVAIIHLNTKGISLNTLYISYVILGFSAGYWVTLITMSAEQFGTNLRATVATSIPNFARAAAVPISIFYQFLNRVFDKNLVLSAMIVGLVCFGLGFWANSTLKESFAKDLDFVE